MPTMSRCARAAAELRMQRGRSRCPRTRTPTSSLKRRACSIAAGSPVGADHAADRVDVDDARVRAHVAYGIDAAQAARAASDIFSSVPRRSACGAKRANIAGGPREIRGLIDRREVKRPCMLSATNAQPRGSSRRSDRRTARENGSRSSG